MLFLEKIKDIIDSHNVISFDIFDTLLLRPYVKPTDLFLHLERIENIEGFAKARIEAEQKARKKHSDKEDITLDEIYNEIAEKYKYLKSKELELERQVLYVNPEIKEVYTYALKQNKRIIIISDMYLSEKFLTNILKEKGYSNFEKLYVSSEYGKCKGRGGKLYLQVLEELKIKNPSNVLHIGDNQRSDVDVAKTLGFDTAHYKKVFDQFLERQEKARVFLNKYPDSLEASMLMMNLAMHELENPNEDFWKRIGYEFGGPICYAYMKWVEKQVLENDIKEILFVARDGYTLQKVFDNFGHKDIKTHYVYAPRQVFCNCFIDEAIEQGRSLSILKGLKDKSYIIQNAFNTIHSIDKANDFIQNNLDLFTKLAADCKNEYYAYIKSLNIQNKKIALIDTCSSFCTATNLISRFFEGNILNLFYLLYKVSDENKKKHHLLSFSLNNRHQYLAWDFFEYMMTSPEYPIQGVENNQVIYMKDVPSEEINRVQIYPLISDQILNFCNIFKEYYFLSFDKDIILEWVNLLFTNYSVQEKAVLSAIKIAGDESHQQYRPLYSNWKNKDIGTYPKNKTKLSILNLPIYKIKTENYFSFKYNEECTKSKIYILGLPLFKTIKSSWFKHTLFCGLKLFKYKYKDNTYSLHFLGLPIFKFTSPKKIKNVNKLKTNTNNNSEFDLCKLNLLMQKKLSTFYIHSQTFPKFKNINKGKDVVIIATGPTLKNFKPIKDAVYIGVNRAIHYDKVHYDYYFVQDYSGATPTYLEDVVSYKDCIKFLGYTAEDTASYRTIPDYLRDGDDIYNYRTDWENIKGFQTTFAYDLATRALGCGGTVVLPALQFALWTHPKRIFLVGVDTSITGYFDNTGSNVNYLNVANLIKKYSDFKEFAHQYYPDIEIISVNPVGLKGIFKDLYDE